MALTRIDRSVPCEAAADRGVQTILHVIGGLNLGGAETVLYRLVSAQGLSGYRHQVLSLGSMGELGPSIEALGVPVYAVNVKESRLGLGALIRLVKIVRLVRPDLIQGWMYHGNIAALLAPAVAGRRLPVCWNIRHCPEDMRIEKKSTTLAIRLGAFFSKLPSRIIYNAHRSADVHISLGYEARNRAIIPNGFDAGLFCCRPEQRIRLRKELGLQGSATLVGVVARYHPMKGHKVLLEAASVLIGEFPDLHFVLVGIAGEGLDELTGLIAERGLASRFSILGIRDDVAEVYAALDVAVSPSLSEAFPNAVGEAMACGVPCVVTDVGDCAELLGDAGVVVPPNDPVTLGQGIASLLRAGPEHREQLGGRARKRIVAGYSLEATVARYRKLYSQVFSERGISRGKTSA